MDRDNRKTKWTEKKHEIENKSNIEFSERIYCTYETYVYLNIERCLFDYSTHWNTLEAYK